MYIKSKYKHKSKKANSKNIKTNKISSNAGYMYVMYHIALDFFYYGSNTYKIGRAEHLPKRLAQYKTSFPDSPESKFESDKCSNVKLAERHVFNRLKSYRMKRRREFFQLDIQLIIETIKDVITNINNGNINKEPIKVPTELTDDEIMEELRLPIDINDDYYKSMINYMDKFNMHNDIIMLLSNDDIINNLTCKKGKQHQLLRELEQTYSIEPLNVSFDKLGNVDMSDDMFTSFKKLFKTEKRKPTNYHELKKMYVGMIKSVSCNKLIGATRIKKRSSGKRDQYDHSLNMELIQDHLTLNHYKDNNINIMSQFVL